MVRANRPASAFTNAQISGFYFRPCRDEYDEVVFEYFRTRTARPSKFIKEPVSAVDARRNNGRHGLLDEFCSAFDDQSLWLDGVDCAVQPSACILRKPYTNLDPISMETLRAGMEGVTREVERKIAAELPARFGVMFDGWTHASEHYVAWFACDEVNGVLVTPLLAMAPLINEPDDNLSARSHYEFLATMLPRDYGVQIDQCRFVVGDNCSVNRSLATLMRVPLVGSGTGADDQAEDAHSVYKTATTRWSSTFDMVKRYFELLEFLDADDDDIMELLPSPASNKRLRALFKELKDVESVAKALQGRDTDLLDVRQWFDELIALKPKFATYLGPQAEIVHSPDFESGCVRVLRGLQDRLTRAEEAVLGPFVRLAEHTDEDFDDDVLSFVERLRKRRRLAEPSVSYEQLKTIPPTSNVVERFFSVARVTFGQQRHGLLPATLEMILFLRENRCYWDSSTVDSIN
ncbi:hypothetical protein F442_00887 [Phytophthora nicotianae P10297]|uniref:HAT C-terminal dimerisation domain-containing protein n=1 Tax=Phytophthora nicotianae P10297 TaxID=1317064 RepID=W3A443_PHYNI|nr:hypothetical protein F442_00887 [Phytophthora nicotianae P10297]